jgi:hypothetical protein
MGLSRGKKPEEMEKLVSDSPFLSLCFRGCFCEVDNQFNESRGCVGLGP